MPFAHLATALDLARDATPLRRAFDKVFEDPRSTNTGRFVWDYWHVPNQYTALRTPAWTFFPKRLYESFHRKLVEFGRTRLGCHNISPPWLSAYVEGCEQRLHADAPHGPYAFVYSLTPNLRQFTGGETTLLRKRSIPAGGEAYFEEGTILDSIPPKFGQLLLFDPRIPHGVRRVSGTHDIRQARLVIHGWFVKPRPFIKGPLDISQAELFGDALSRVLASHGERLSTGFISFRCRVSAAGRATQLTTLASTLDMSVSTRDHLESDLRQRLDDVRWPKRSTGSTITWPVLLTQ